MNTSRIDRRSKARDDVQSAIDFYLTEAGETTAAGFLEAIDAALQHVARMPTAGSSRL